MHEGTCFHNKCLLLQLPSLADFPVNYCSNLRIRTAYVTRLRHCATTLKVAGSIPDGVIGIFH
jgi:hypothetical protein